MSAEIRQPFNHFIRGKVLTTLVAMVYPSLRMLVDRSLMAWLFAYTRVTSSVDELLGHEWQWGLRRTSAEFLHCEQGTCTTIRGVECTPFPFSRTFEGDVTLFLKTHSTTLRHVAFCIPWLHPRST